MPLYYPPVNFQIGGNTAGATAVVNTGSLTLAGGNNITLSQAGNAVTISAGASGGFQAVIGGNSAGIATTISSGTLTLAGGNNIVLSQAGNSIVISGGLTSPTLNYWENMNFANQSSMMALQSPLIITPLVPGGPFPGNMTVQSMLLNISGSSTSTTGSAAYTWSFGIYAASSSTALLLIASATTNLSLTNLSAQSSLYNGARWLSVSGWSTNTALTAGTNGLYSTAVSSSKLQLSAGAYWLGMAASSSISNVFSYIGNFFMGASAAGVSQRWGTLGVGTTNSNTGYGIGPSFGYSATTGLATSVSFNALINASSIANFQPMIVFNNNYAVF